MASKYIVITISYIYENVKTGDEDMKATEVIRKANSGEGLTVEEIKIYNANVKPQKHVYGKYGTLAKSISKIKGSTGRLQISPNIYTA